MRAMRYIRALSGMAALAACLLWGMPAQAATLANSTLTNFVTLDYVYQGNPGTATASSTIVVSELINHTLTWQDAASVMVAPGDTQRVLTFDLHNTGNGSEPYSLITNTAIPGSDFAPLLTGLYLDTNSSGIYDAGDTLYTPGTYITVAPDATLRLFAVSDIPVSAAGGDTGSLGLSALSNTVTPGAPLATVLPGAGDGGTDAVVGLAGGLATATGSYYVGNTVSLMKTAVINSPGGGYQPVTGATIEYSITVTVTGTVTATGIEVTDPLPAGTTYQAGTLTLDGAALTDALDADAGDVGATTPGTVTVNTGSMSGASTPRVVSFKVTIN